MAVKLGVGLKKFRAVMNLCSAISNCQNHVLLMTATVFRLLPCFKSGRDAVMPTNSNLSELSDSCC